MAEFSGEELKPVLRHCQLCLIRGVEIEATYFCISCNSLICDDCETKHRATSVLQSHAVHRVTVESNSAMFSDFCQAHPDQNAPYWCDTCTHALCTSCLIHEHEGHEIKYITKYLSELVIEGQMSEKLLLNLKRNFLSTMSVIEEILGNLDPHVSISEREIKSQCFGLIKQIKKTEQNLIRKLKAKQQYMSDNLKNEYEQLDQNLDKVNSWFDKKTSVFSSVENNNITARLADLVSNGKELTRQEHATVLNADFVQFNREDNMAFCDLSVPALCLNKKPVWSLKDDKEIERHITLISEDMLAVLYDKSIKLYDIGLDHVTPILLSTTSVDVHDMFCMAACGATLHVTCCHAKCKTVHQYTITEGQLVWSTQQWQNNMFTKPRGIAGTKSQNIIVSDFVHDRFGEKPKQVSMHSSSDGTRLLTIKTGTGYQPSYVACGTDCIIVSNEDTHYVHVFEMDGKRKTMFGGKGNKSGQLNNPHGVCTDREDNILVADTYNKRTSLFDNQGRFICHLLTNHFADISNPNYISWRVIGLRTFLIVNATDIYPNPGVKMFELHNCN